MQRTKSYPNERLQLDDYEALAQLVLDELVRSNRVILLPSGRTTGGAATSARILSGFAISGVAGGTCTLSRGTGILGFYDQGELKHGLLLGEEEPPSYALDFSALPDSDYAIWVRLVYSDSDTENRVFWNPDGTPAEYLDNVASRSTPSWEYLIQDNAVAPPGHGEWTKIWKIAVASGAIGVQTPYHHLFFEGDASATYPQEWGGGANDRNADRRLYGIGDFHNFVQLVRRQLSDIIGVKHYTAAPIDLTQLAVEHDPSDGHHTDLTAETALVYKWLKVYGEAGEEAALQVRGGYALDKDALGLFITAAAELAGGERNYMAIDRQGVLSLPNVMSERFLYADMADIETGPGVPGARWGKYFTSGASVIAATGMCREDNNNLHGRKLYLETPAGVFASVFGGVRTGGVSNGQALGGFWRIKSRPWMRAVFVFPTLTAAGGCKVGFFNDRSPLNSDPSCCYVEFDHTADTAYLTVIASDGTAVTGTQNLLTHTMAADTVYRIKISIMGNNIVRAVLENWNVSDEVLLPPGKTMIETYGGPPYMANYSSFITAQTNNGMVDSQGLDVYCWDVGDLCYWGQYPTL